MLTRPEVRLRMLTSDDAGWATGLDRESTPFARGRAWQREKLAAELDEGVWANDERCGWAVVADGEPIGLALVESLASRDGSIDLRISSGHRGRGIGREVLRQLADHHFADQPTLLRLSGRTHEQNVPMQRAFNAAGFRMEARYRDTFPMGDDRASEWGYALTRADWEAGRHRADEDGYDLHGLQFEVEDSTGDQAHVTVGTIYHVDQEGRRLFARYSGGDIVNGELAGILSADLLVYRFVQDYETPSGLVVESGGGRSRLQRRHDGRLELVNDWSGDDGRHGSQVLAERR